MWYVTLIKNYAAGALITGRVSAGQRRVLDHIARAGCVDKLVVADINAYVADGRSAAAEEYQIARQKVIAGNTGGCIILCLCDTRNGTDRSLEHVRGEAGAVKAARRAAAVNIRDTEELRSVVQYALALCADRNRCSGVRRGDRRAVRAGRQVIRADVAGLACVGYLAPAVGRVLLFVVLDAEPVVDT